MNSNPPKPSSSGFHSRWLIGLALGLAIPAAMIGPDLFMAIEWPVRKVIGQVLLVGVGVLVLWRSIAAGRAGRWSATLEPNHSQGGAALWMHLSIASLALNWMRFTDSYGFGDWDHHFQKYEALRRSIVDWGQFPWWNPWCRGGFPLAAEPECGVISVATIFVLLFGTTHGLRLATIFYVHLAAEGTRRLARIWFRDSYATALAGVVYAINGAVAVYLAAGHFIPMSYPWLPWVVLLVFRLEVARRYGWGLGLIGSALILGGIQYPSVYAMVLGVVCWLLRICVLTGAARQGFLVGSARALSVIGLLAGWRIAVMGAVMLDYPRHHESLIDNSVGTVLRTFWSRYTPERLVDDTEVGVWESACYIGPVASLLFLISLFRTRRSVDEPEARNQQGLLGWVRQLPITLQWRWWHTLAVISIWLSIGTIRVHQLSFWVSDLPLFSSMHQASRWRIVGLLGIALGVAAAVSRLRESRKRRWRGLAWLGLLCWIDLLVYAHQVIPIACRVSAETIEQLPSPTERLVNLEYAQGLGAPPQLLTYPALLRGYGVIRAHEPLLGYDRGDPTARIWKGHPKYVGEYWAMGPVEPEFWSPNRIEFEIEPNQQLELNVNPGSWWRVNGETPFADWRCAEWRERFVVRSDVSGRVVVEIVPKGILAAWILTLAGGAAVAILAATDLRTRSRLGDNARSQPRKK